MTKPSPITEVMAPRTVEESMTSPISGMAGKLRSATGQLGTAPGDELTERWALDGARRPLGT